ncbi:hypothetical protein IE81DRAFT_349372 [Ceraceosorus guamensis]|uniref:DNA replication regulator SLD2 n=1 Tax=Ceraceosorus guamensis TaxID=1522189 RepID=A0A316VRQ4_9BASI|nr:hypothetical protein IE81DRAFT_349372 [Ceraceosorus guamensis]PWN40277.1 hypothetical protein IE81DRAFT_349372 [Ceraceosorus guamensis]
MEAILARDLKAWQRDFRQKNGREPTKRDMAKHPEIAGTYETWAAIKSASKAGPSKPKKEGSAPANDAVFKTPTKRVRYGATGGAGTSASYTPTKLATPANPITPPRNPFATPTSQRIIGKEAVFSTPVRGTRAPSSASSARSVVLNDVLTTPSSGRGQYASNSPTALRTLLSSSRSPNTRAHLRQRQSTRIEEALRATFTPRTKARKRLRGEEVPVTPARSKRARGAGQLVQNEQVEDAGGSKSWARSLSSPVAPMHADNDGLFASSPKRAASFKALFDPSPMARRRDSSIDTLARQPSWSPRPSSATLLTSPAEADEADESGAESDVAQMTMDNAEFALIEREEAEALEAAAKRANSPAEMLVIDAEDEEAAVQIRLRQYQRRGAPSGNYDYNDADGDVSRLLARPEHSSDPSSYATDDASFACLTLASPQTRGARQAARARQARHFETLFAAGHEALDLEAEKAEIAAAAASSKPGQKSTWGHAKGREALEAKKSGPAKGKGASIRAFPKAPLPGQIPKPVRKREFRRAGRSGMGEDEVCVRRRNDAQEEADDASYATRDEDDDWASEVSSVEYGLGDGEMDRMDVL